MVIDILTITLMMTETSLEISQDNTATNIDYDDNVRNQCLAMMERGYAITIISSILIMLLMTVLLRYIAMFIPFLYTFVKVVQQVIYFFF